MRWAMQMSVGGWVAFSFRHARKDESRRDLKRWLQLCRIFSSSAIRIRYLLKYIYTEAYLALQLP